MGRAPSSNGRRLALVSWRDWGSMDNKRLIKRFLKEHFYAFFFNMYPLPWKEFIFCRLWGLRGRPRRHGGKAPISSDYRSIQSHESSPILSIYFFYRWRRWMPPVDLFKSCHSKRPLYACLVLGVQLTRVFALYSHIFWTRILALAMTCWTKNIDLSIDSFVASECMQIGRWCIMNKEEDSW